MLIRIVDIGSNSIKASVYDVQNQDHKAIARDKLSFSLGEEVFSNGAAPGPVEEPADEGGGTKAMDRPPRAHRKSTSAWQVDCGGAVRGAVVS